MKDIIQNPNNIMGSFDIRLFCWNWNFFAESTLNKGKN